MNPIEAITQSARRAGGSVSSVRAREIVEWIMTHRPETNYEDPADVDHAFGLFVSQQSRSQP